MGMFIALATLLAVIVNAPLAQAVQAVNYEQIMLNARKSGLVSSLDSLADTPVLRVGTPWYKEELTDRAGIVHAAAYEVMRTREKAQKSTGVPLLVKDAASGRTLTIYRPGKPLIIDGQVTKPRWDKHFPQRRPPLYPPPPFPPQ